MARKPTQRPYRARYEKSDWQRVYALKNGRQTTVSVESDPYWQLYVLIGQRSLRDLLNKAVSEAGDGVRLSHVAGDAIKKELAECLAARAAAREKAKANA